MKEIDGKRIISTFGIAATFIGTVIGAGFASGQEILQFFGRYGLAGLFGIGIATVLMCSATYKIFSIGMRLKSDSYRDFLRVVIGPKLINTADFFFFGFTLVLIGVMFAGCGEIFEQLGIGYWKGVGVTAVILIAVLFYDLPGLMAVNMVVIPLMFLATLGISLFAAFHRPNPILLSVKGYSWLVAALQFTSYNIILSLPVLLSMARRHSDQHILRWGGWLGSLVLGVMTVLIYWALVSHFGILQYQDLPMVLLAKIWGKPVFFGYILIIWGEMITTLLADTYGLGKRMVTLTGWPFRWSVSVLTGIGIGIAKIGFTDLITNCYPVFGLLSMMLLVFIYFKSAKIDNILKNISEM